MTLFTPEFESIQADINYHREQITEAKERLDQIKVAQAYSDTAIAGIEDCIENIDPFYLPILRGHIESMFSVTSNEVKEETHNEVESVSDTPQEIIEKESDPKSENTPQQPDKEFGSLTYHQVTGRPDLRPSTYDDLAPNISYSSDGRAYVGFNDKDEAEEFRDAISEPSLLDAAVIMNDFKFEVKFYCKREYAQEIANSVNSMSDDPVCIHPSSSGISVTATENFEEINPRVIYNHNDQTVYLGMTAKNRCDYYGQLLTGQLTVGEKYTYSSNPSFINNEEYKYELRITEINLEDAIHLASFNLQRDPEHPDNAKLLTDWRANKVRELDLGKPSPKLTPLAEIKLGDIVYLNSIDNQYKVLSKVELDGIPHIEVICVFNSERPSLVSATSFLKECYLVDPEGIQIDPQFQEVEQEEVLTEGVNIYIPKPKSVEVSVFELGAGDTVHRGISDSQYEVIGTTRKDADLYAECRLISSSTRAASIGNTYFFKDGLYLVEEETVKPEPVTV